MKSYRPAYLYSLSFSLGLLFVSVCLTYYARNSLLAYRHQMPQVSRPPLYLPKASYVKLLTLGYDGLASKLFWFGTINYFGRQFALKQDYRWLGQMCDLVTTLDARTTHTIEFCGTLLSWVGKAPEKSTEILSRGISQQPHYWRYWYLRGFTYWYFLNRLDLAKDDFYHAANLPNAPLFLSTLTSRLLANEESPTLAKQFLQEMIANTTDPSAKKMLKRKLKKAILSEGLLTIQQAITGYVQQLDKTPLSVEDLIRVGVLKEIPIEPYKGTYIIEDGVAKTSSKKKGLEFKGKTAQTSGLSELNGNIVLGNELSRLSQTSNSMTISKSPPGEVSSSGRLNSDGYRK